MATAAALARSFGHAPASIALLRGLGSTPPEAWTIAEEQAVNAQEGLVDLLAADELEEAMDLEDPDLPFGAELTQMAVFETLPDDEAKMKTYTLTPIPQLLIVELQNFINYRCSTFQAKRSGGAVVSLSAEGDKRQLLRYFGWMNRTDRVPENKFIQFQLLLRADVGDTVQDYVTFLRERQKLRFRCSHRPSYDTTRVRTRVYRQFDCQLPELARRAGVVRIHDL